MSVNAFNHSRVRKRHEDFSEVTVPYPPDLLIWPDDEDTVMVDPSEMLQTAQAMMFLDTAVIELGSEPSKSRNDKS
jgi:hypothetical protein